MPAQMVRVNEESLTDVPHSFHSGAMVRYNHGTLDGIAKSRCNIQVSCQRCQHKTFARPTALISLLPHPAQFWPLERIEPKLKCSECGARDARIVGVWRD